MLNTSKISVFFGHLGEIGGTGEAHEWLNLQESVQIWDRGNNNANSNLPPYPVPCQYEGYGSITKDNPVPSGAWMLEWSLFRIVARRGWPKRWFGHGDEGWRQALQRGASLHSQFLIQKTVLGSITTWSGRTKLPAHNDTGKRAEVFLTWISGPPVLPPLWWTHPFR